jgi:hypothetical protein
LPSGFSRNVVFGLKLMERALKRPPEHSAIAYPAVNDWAKEKQDFEDV